MGLNIENLKKLDGYEEEIEICSNCKTELGVSIINPMDTDNLFKEEVVQKNLQNNYLSFIPNENMEIKGVKMNSRLDKWENSYINIHITGICKKCGTEKNIYNDDRDITGY